MAAVAEVVRDEAPSIVGGRLDVQRAALRLYEEAPQVVREVQNVLIEIRAPQTSVIVETRRHLRVAVTEAGEQGEPWFVAHLVEHPGFAGDADSWRGAIEALVARMVNDLLVYEGAARLSLDAQEAQTRLRSILNVRSLR